MAWSGVIEVMCGYLEKSEELQVKSFGMACRCIAATRRGRELAYRTLDAVLPVFPILQKWLAHLFEHKKISASVPNQMKPEKRLSPIHFASLAGSPRPNIHKALAEQGKAGRHCV